LKKNFWGASDHTLSGEGDNHSPHLTPLGLGTSIGGASIPTPHFVNPGSAPGDKMSTVDRPLVLNSSGGVMTFLLMTSIGHFSNTNMLTNLPSTSTFFASLAMVQYCQKLLE